MRIIVSRLMLASAGILVTLVLGEGLFRALNNFHIIGYRKINTAYDFKCFQRGKYYWIGFRPNSSCTLKSNLNAFPDAVIKTNSFGFRNPEIKIPKPAGTVRILFIGDSFTLGWGVAEKRSFPGLVENMLQDKIKDKKIEVINAGLASSGPSYYYLLLKNEIKAINPDIIVINYYLLNDISEDLIGSDWQNIDSYGLPQQADSKISYVDYQGQARVYASIIKTALPLLNKSQLFDYLTDFIPNRKHKPWELLNHETCFFKKSCSDSDLIKANEKMKLLISGTKNIADENGKKLLMVLIPAEVQVYSGIRFKYGIALPLTPDEKKYPDMEIADFMAEKQIDHLDLLPVFLKNNNLKMYYELDNHWNETGHQIAAEAIGQKLTGMINK